MGYFFRSVGAAASPVTRYHLGRICFKAPFPPKGNSRIICWNEPGTDSPGGLGDIDNEFIGIEHHLGERGSGGLPPGNLIWAYTLTMRLLLLTWKLLKMWPFTSEQFRRKFRGGLYFPTDDDSSAAKKIIIVDIYIHCLLAPRWG